MFWEDAAPSRVLDSFTLTGNDLKAHNGFDAPQNIAPNPSTSPQPPTTARGWNSRAFLHRHQFLCVAQTILSAHGVSAASNVS